MSGDEEKSASPPLIPTAFVNLTASATQCQAGCEAFKSNDETKKFLDACIEGYLDARLAWEKASELEKKATTALAETGRPPKNAIPQYVDLVVWPKINDAPALFDDIRAKLEKMEQDAAKVILEARVSVRKKQAAHYKSKMQGDVLVATKTDEFVKSVLTPFADDWDNTFASANGAKFPRADTQKWFIEELNARISRAFSDSHQRRVREEQLKREREAAELKAQAEVLAGAHSGESLQRLADRSARKAVTEEIKQLQRQGAQHKLSGDGATQEQDPPAPAPKVPTNNQRDNSKQPPPTHQREQGQRGHPKGQRIEKGAQKPTTHRGHNQQQGPARFRKRQLPSRSRSPRHQMPSPTRAEHRENDRQDNRAKSRSPPRGKHIRGRDDFKNYTRRQHSRSRSRSRDRERAQGYGYVRRDRCSRSRSADNDRRAGMHREPLPKNGAGGDKHNGSQRQQRSISPRGQRDSRGKEGSSHEHKAEQRPSERR